MIFVFILRACESRGILKYSFEEIVRIYIRFIAILKNSQLKVKKVKKCVNNMWIKLFHKLSKEKNR